MSLITRYVDPDATGTGTGVDWANAYVSLSAWEAAEQTDLVSDGDSHIVYCRKSGSTNDSVFLTMDGWTTGVSNTLKIVAASTDYSEKNGFDSAKYTRTAGMVIRDSYVTIEGIQFNHGSTYQYCSKLDNAGSTNIIFKNCWFELDGAGQDGIQLENASVSCRIECCIFNGSASSTEGIQLTTGSSVVISFCDIYGMNIGINRLASSGATTTIKSCAIFNNTNDINDPDATATIDYCATDDGDGTNSVSPSGADWDNEYNDSTNGDFTLLNGGNCYHGGTPVSGVTTDIEGDTYHVTTPSIGVDEYVAAVTGNPWYYYSQQ